MRGAPGAGAAVGFGELGRRKALGDHVADRGGAGEAGLMGQRVPHMGPRQVGRDAEPERTKTVLLT